MTTFQVWLDASLDIMKANIAILDELKEENDLDKLIVQGYVLKRHLDSFTDFMEKRRKFG